MPRLRFRVASRSIDPGLLLPRPSAALLYLSVDVVYVILRMVSHFSVDRIQVCGLQPRGPGRYSSDDCGLGTTGQGLRTSLRNDARIGRDLSWYVAHRA